MTSDRFLAIISAALLALLAGLYGWQIRSSTNDNNNKNQHRPSHQTLEKATPETPDERIADWTEYLGIFTALLVSISAIQIFFLIRADKTARDNAQAVLRSVVTSENTAERQLRAYVFVHETDVWVSAKASGKYVVFKITFQNFGQTPAYDFGSWSEIKIQANDPKRIPQSASRPSRNSSIGPGAKSTIVAEELISQQDLDDVIAGRKFIFHCCRIDYIDAFDSERHFDFYFKNGPQTTGGPTPKWLVANASG